MGTENQNQSPDEKAKQEEKDLKRLLDAHVLVLKSKLGRTPSLEDIESALAEKQAAPQPSAPAPTEKTSAPAAEVSTTPEKIEKTQEQSMQQQGNEFEPRILSMRVYYGMSDDGKGSKNPDPNKVLFYEHPADGSTFCTESQAWSDKAGRPSVLDHLPHRPIEYSDKDIIAAIAHGVMDDRDYEALDKAGMLTDTPKKLWGLTKKLKTQMEELEKSQESENEQASASAEGAKDSEPTRSPGRDAETRVPLENTGKSDSKSEEAVNPDAKVDPDLTPEGNKEFSDDLISAFLSTAGIESTKQQEVRDVLGEDILSKIMQAANAQALTGLEDQIRAIVLDELQKAGLSSDSEGLSYDESSEEGEEPEMTEPLEESGEME